MDATEKRNTMNGKPVFEVPAKTVLNWSSGFAHKLLCSEPGLTFTCGTACAYSCCFCYVPDAMSKSPHMNGIDLPLEDVVIRRTGAVDALRQQVVAAKNGRGRKAALFRQPSPFKVDPPLVVYSSPLVDVAANGELCAETVAACIVILEETPWDIRLLSKSHLLPKIAQALLKWEAEQGGTTTSDFAPKGVRARMIFGVSTGTLDNTLARCFEQGTPLVSKRIESLHWLQDNGFRTFGMICPSLPQQDYHAFAQQMAIAIRAERCEHVWAEVINVRGDSMTRTVNALLEGGYEWEASTLAAVSMDKVAWERYSRQTFLAHAPLYPAGKLRFLQYINKENRDWWIPRQERGAVLLGVLPKPENI